MLINRAIESLRRLRLDGRLLGRRARSKGDARAPLVLVPGMFGTRIVDESGHVLWGSTGSLYRGPSALPAPGTRAGGAIDGFTLVPGLYGYDVHGALVRFLQAVGGYRAGEDLHILDYDWRLGVRDGARSLAETIDRLRGAGEERVDLVGISTGGMLVRAFLAEGDARVVRRAVHVGTPQRGTFDALVCLSRGFRFAPGGKRFGGSDAALLQTSWDALPHPGEPLFVDEEGQPLALDHHDAATWEKLSLLPPGLTASAIERPLAIARELHALLDGAPSFGESVVIGARHLPTPHRAVVIGKRAHLPSPTPRRDDPFIGFTYAPGDGELPATSLRALPGLDEQRLWFARPDAHHKLPSDPVVHRLILEALLATERHIPSTSLERAAPAC